MKIAFMGSDAIALPLLDHLQGARPGGARIALVHTQPDRRSGRGLHLQANAIKQWALRHGIEVRQPVKCGADDARDLQASGIDLVLVMAYGQILPRALLESVPLGFLNLHASLLPRLRGASPIHTAVALGLERTGVSLMRIIPKLDAGPVADAESVLIGADDTAAQLHDKLAAACVPLLDRALPELAAGRLVFHEQDEARVTYCRIIEKTDAQLDFTQPARDLANRVRAFEPWPGTVFPVNDTEIRIVAAVAEEQSIGGAPGTFHTAPDGAVRIACAGGCLRLLRLQRPGGRPLPAAEFLRGFPVADGSLIASRPMRPLEAALPFPYRRKGI